MKSSLNSTSNSATVVGIIFKIADGTIQSCNKDAEIILGYTSEQLIGASSFDPPWQTIHKDGSNFPPETHPAIASLSTGQPCSNVIMGFYKPSGELVWLSIDTLPLFKANSNQPYGVEISFIEVTNEDSAEISCVRPRIISGLQTKKKLIDELPGIIYLYDAIAHCNIYVNSQAFDSLGYNSQEISELGANFVTQVMHPEDFPLFLAHLERLETSQAKETLKFEYRMRHKNGEWRWFCSQDRVSSRTEDGSLQQIIGIARDITNRKQIEIALRESEERLKLATEASRIGMWFWDLVEDSLEFTQQCKAIFGLPADAEISYEKFIDTLHPDDRDRTKKALNEALTNKTEYDIEYRVVLPDDCIRWIAAKGKGFYEDGEPIRMMGTVQDISERKQNEIALQQSQDELKLITQIIPQQVWTALPDGKIDYINQRWHEYTGYNLEEIEKRGWSVIVHPEDLQQVQETWAKAIESGENYNVKARLRRKDGKYCWFLGRARSLCNDRGEVVKWYGTNTGINRIKELEEKLQQQTEDLIQANKLKDEFLAIVSHELRTPLNPILGWSQLLASGRLNPAKTAQGIAIIERNAKLQTQLIDDLLDVSSIIRDNIDLKTIPLNLESVIRSALTTIQLAAKAKSIQIETIFEPNVERVAGDPGRLQQVVWNLVSNAIKFTPEGGKVTVTLEQIGRQALIQVKDTGKGIESEFLPYVFERFRQAESSNTREFGGLGLGLTIVRHLTELHNGTVEVSSLGEGQGTTFSLRFPLINTPKTLQEEDISFDRSTKFNSFNDLKILVVDDEPDSQDILTLVLEQEGAIVTSVASAQTALSAFNKLSFDLIISDIGMPEVNGYTLITRIRELPQGKNIPAIALTAYAEESDRQRSLDRGFQHHLSKPINIPQLLETVTQLTNK